MRFLIYGQYCGARSFWSQANRPNSWADSPLSSGYTKNNFLLHRLTTVARLNDDSSGPHGRQRRIWKPKDNSGCLRQHCSTRICWHYFPSLDKIGGNPYSWKICGYWPLAMFAQRCYSTKVANGWTPNTTWFPMIRPHSPRLYCETSLNQVHNYNWNVTTLLNRWPESNFLDKLSDQTFHHTLIVRKNVSFTHTHYNLCHDQLDLKRAFHVSF